MLQNSPLRNRFILVTGAILILGWLLYLGRGALFPFILGLVLAYILLPAVNWLENHISLPPHQKDLARLFSVSILYLVVIGLLSLFLAFLVPPLAKETGRLVQSLPLYITKAGAMAQDWTQQYRATVPPDIQAKIDEELGQGADVVGGIIRETLIRTIRIVSQTLSVALGLALVPAWLFYILKDQKKAIAGFYSMFPPSSQGDVQEIIRIVDRILAAYIRAQLLLGLLVGVGVGIGLTFMGVDFALVLGVFAGITELIPVVGPVLGAIPAVIVTLATSPGLVVWVILLFVGVQVVENNFLVPRIQGEAMQIHPAIIMVLMIIASEVAGVWGMLVVVPLAAVTRDIFKYLYKRWGEGPLDRVETGL